MNSINQILRWGKIRLVVTTKTEDERADLFVCFPSAYSICLFLNLLIIVDMWFGKISHVKSEYKMCFLLLHFAAYH